MLTLAAFEIPTGRRAWIEDVVTDACRPRQGRRHRAGRGRAGARRRARCPHGRPHVAPRPRGRQPALRQARLRAAHDQRLPPDPRRVRLGTRRGRARPSWPAEPARRAGAGGCRRALLPPGAPRPPWSGLSRRRPRPAPEGRVLRRTVLDAEGDRDGRFSGGAVVTSGRGREPRRRGPRHLGGGRRAGGRACHTSAGASGSWWQPWRDRCARDRVQRGEQGARRTCTTSKATRRRSTRSPRTCNRTRPRPSRRPT